MAATVHALPVRTLDLPEDFDRAARVADVAEVFAEAGWDPSGWLLTPAFTGELETAIAALGRS